MNNLTEEYDTFNAFQRNFVKMAVDEFNSPQQNWTDLVLRYWTVIDERLGGRRSPCGMTLRLIVTLHDGMINMTSK